MTLWDDVTPNIEGRYREQATAMLCDHNVRVIRWLRYLRGAAYFRSCTKQQGYYAVEAPHPKSELSFAILAHEVAHHRLGHTTYPTRDKRYREEFDAWFEALVLMNLYGVPITERVLKRMRRQIHYAFAKAVRRGLKDRPQDVMAYLGIEHDTF